LPLSCAFHAASFFRVQKASGCNMTAYRMGRRGSCFGCAVEFKLTRNSLRQAGQGGAVQDSRFRARKFTPLSCVSWGWPPLVGNSLARIAAACGDRLSLMVTGSRGSTVLFMGLFTATLQLAVETPRSTACRPAPSGPPVLQAALERGRGTGTALRRFCATALQNRSIGEAAGKAWPASRAQRSWWGERHPCCKAQSEGEVVHR